MRTVHVSEITKNIKEMCIEANHFLTQDMDEALKQACVSEKSQLGRQVLDSLQKNLQIAGEDMIPICQDTGMAVIFIKVGQEVHFEDGYILIPDKPGLGIDVNVEEALKRPYTPRNLRHYTGTVTDIRPKDDTVYYFKELEDKIYE